MDLMLNKLNRSAQAEREIHRNTPMRRARTCYDHLAGVAGVELFVDMLCRGWIIRADAGNHPEISLTSAGREALMRRGVDVERAQDAKRKFGYGCLDWTERRHHLGGALGAQVLAALEASGTIGRLCGDRTVCIQGSVGHWLDD